jgi:thiol-disulfide isomerase/thioredoxin
VEETLTEDVDSRVRVTRREAPSLPAGYNPAQQEAACQPEEQQQPQQQASNADKQATESNNNNKANDNDDDSDDSDFDSDFDDDPALEAIRERRLAQIRRAQIKHAENKAKGHGEYRTISQDGFLPECTGSEYVAVHFFHNDFERCKIMDFHLKKIAPYHLTCKFLRIDAENAPFFVAKLTIQTLPTVVVFNDGKEIKRLLGFEGLADSSSPDEWPTGRLQKWLALTGAIDYNPTEEDDEEEEEAANRINKMGASPLSSAAARLRGRFNMYDEDM